MSEAAMQVESSTFLFCWFYFFEFFKRQIHSDIYKCNFLRIEFTSVRSHQLTEGSRLCISPNPTPKSSNKYLIWIVNVKSLKLSRSSGVRGRLYRSLHPKSSNFRYRFLVPSSLTSKVTRFDNLFPHISQTLHLNHHLTNFMTNKKQ
jgi:hypothetical protein